MLRKFWFSRIWPSAQDHAILALLLNLVGFFIFARPRWSGGNVLYHSCTSFEGSSWRGQPLQKLTWFIGACGYIHGAWKKNDSLARKILFCNRVRIFDNFHWNFYTPKNPSNQEYIGVAISVIMGRTGRGRWEGGGGAVAPGKQAKRQR